MLILVIFAVLVVTWLCFYYFARQQDETWQRFRQRKKDRLENPPSEHPFDPTFQFDRAPPEPPS